MSITLSGEVERFLEINLKAKNESFIKKDKNQRWVYKLWSLSVFIN